MALWLPHVYPLVLFESHSRQLRVRHVGGQDQEGGETVPSARLLFPYHLGCESKCSVRVGLNHRAPHNFCFHLNLLFPTIRNVSPQRNEAWCREGRSPESLCWAGWAVTHFGADWGNLELGPEQVCFRSHMQDWGWGASSRGAEGVCGWQEGEVR